MEHDVIQSSPHLTIIPAYRVNAVVEVPWGVHPTDVIGYYNLDFFMYGTFMMADGTADGLKSWMDEWVYGCADRAAYRDRYVQKFGSKILDGIQGAGHFIRRRQITGLLFLHGGILKEKKGPWA